ncbi:MAG: pyrimidine/purine nucleoside phosphorylase [Candidatus Omnitrophica bacterium]|nr:pyrimidine/purine nucleoside phosphorylase [Candidatus Omnitrophota bacterium]
MVKVNEYFEGKVKSLVVDAPDGRKTVGVMEPGEYEFATETKEIMTVIVGTISVFFPEDNDWEDFAAGASFDIPAKSKLRVKVSEDTAYLCLYE